MGRATAASSGFETSPPQRTIRFTLILILILILIVLLQCCSGVSGQNVGHQWRDPLPENVETYMTAVSNLT